MKKNLSILIILLLCITLHAQQIRPDVVNTVGGSAQYSGGYFAWSVGEPVIGSVNGLGGSTLNINQGFLQTLPGLAKQLFLTLYLEGLWNGSGLNKAQNESGDNFPGDVADKVQLELHNAANYSQIAYSSGNVDLSTSGVVTLFVPSTYTGSYYLTVKHRNSVQTTSASVVNFSGLNINYDFTSIAAKAFGNNMKAIDGIFVIFGGDVNQDGVVDALDMIPVDNQAANFGTGYIPEDINGDGSIDTLDMNMLNNNAAAFIGAVLPY